MTFAEQQRHAHIERQRRLGKIAPASPPPCVTQRAPAEPKRVASPAQARMVAALQKEVAQLAARLEAMLREDQSPLVMPSRIKPVISAVAKYYGVSSTDIVSFRRTQHLIRPRQVAMYLAKQLTKHSLPAIGLVFERDHTTVLHGCQQIASLRRQDRKLDAEIKGLVERLTPGEQQHE